MNNIKVKGIYKHFKGDLYLVEDIAIDSETERKVKMLFSFICFFIYFLH